RPGDGAAPGAASSSPALTSATNPAMSTRTTRPAATHSHPRRATTRTITGVRDARIRLCRADAERMPGRVGEHHPPVAGLELGPGRAGGDQFGDRGVDVGNLEVEVGLLGRVGPGRRTVPGHPL